MYEGNATATLCVAILQGDSPSGVAINMVTIDDTARCKCSLPSAESFILESL